MVAIFYNLKLSFMRLAIISDLHDNLPNLKNFLLWARAAGIEKIINLGDVANPETLRYLAKNFSGEIFLVKGNAELYEEATLKKFKNITYFGLVGQTKIDNLKLGFVHRPTAIKDLLAANPNEIFDFIFHGHTHKPWLKNDGPTIISNPGTLGGVFQLATFSTLDTSSKKLELKILETL